MTVTEKHLKSAVAANKNRRSGVQSYRPWIARRVRCELFQNEIGEWKIRLNGGSDLPANDAEVSLWLDLQELKAKCSG